MQGVSDVRIRPMTVDDAPAAERVTAIGFHELDTRMFRRSWPDPQLRPPERSADWISRTRHLVGTDPGGCWVAERDDELLGVVVSFVREKMWLLASYAVVPRRAGPRPRQGPARAGARARARMPAGDAQRVQRPEGAASLPRGGLHGCTPRCSCAARPTASQIPVVEKVREGTETDIDLMDSVDRQTRGAAHGVDHRAPAPAVPAGRQRDARRRRATPTSTTASPCSPRPTGVRRHG